MPSFEPELWIARPSAALDFYASAFGAVVVHMVGGDEELVAQLSVDGARFWISNSGGRRLDPLAAGGATGRVLLVVDDPDAVVAQAVRSGAEARSPVSDEHGWRLGRLLDPFGHEWEIGKPLGVWPPRVNLS